ncbi:hypothetical protein CGLO_17980 [Colletotrichum gloeosporioides Cg-14]|uniref:Uncharacterized protein n=1 Tax=Colletotrichum gloeosporioides (strain Cg-14) TaxID=1237896 RepID=T0JVE7_COLGC|nr:hypothetical protein CGLO_17980 [Colletotrichum gloeosporioides Cg-14]
MNTSALLSVLI